MELEPKFSEEAPPVVRIVHRRKWGAWTVGVLTLLLLFILLRAGIRARVIVLETFGHYLFNIEILAGVWNALMLGTLALLIASVSGLFVAMARLSGNPILASISTAYVYLFRGIPMLIQILFWYNTLPIMFPNVRIALPLLREPVIDLLMVDIITPFRAALLGIALAETAYMSEIIRGGLSSVDKGQKEAAKSLGLRNYQVMTHVVIPQTVRMIIPSVGNEYINLMKSTSLAMTIGYMEVLRVATNIYYTTFEVVELLAVAAFWYLILGAFATLVQAIAEKLYPHR